MDSGEDGDGMRTIQVKLEPEILIEEPKYAEILKRRAAEKLAIELYNDIVSRKNYSVVLIRDKEWLTGNPARPELNYKISYELTESRYADFVNPYIQPKEVIKEVFIFVPKIEYKHYQHCYCDFSWSRSIHDMGFDIRKRIRRVVWKVKRYINNYIRRHK